MLVKSAKVLSHIVIEEETWKIGQLVGEQRHYENELNSIDCQLIDKFVCGTHSGPLQSMGKQTIVLDIVLISSQWRQ